jgi:hypothetical protein
MKLDDLPKKNIYQVPDRYFDQLPGRVMSRVREKETANYPSAILTFLRQPFLRGALAGLAIVLSFIFIFTLNPKNPQPANPSSDAAGLLSNISQKDAIDYLMTSDQLDTQDLSALSLSNEDLSHEFIQVTREDIMQAVENEDIGEIYLY